MNTIIRSAFCLLVTLASCAAPAPVADYSSFYERQPLSILILPVFNETTSAEAPESFNCTISNPIIQRGYYVYPTAPSLAIMQSQGVFEGEQLKDVSPSVFRDVLGADAVLYVTLHAWDTTYMILASGVTVAMTYELVDTATGTTLWKDSRTQSVSSDTSSGSLLAMAINAAVTAAATSYVQLARQANAVALTSLPAGPLSPHFEAERDQYLAQ